MAYGAVALEEDDATCAVTRGQELASAVKGHRRNDISYGNKIITLCVGVRGFTVSHLNSVALITKTL